MINGQSRSIQDTPEYTATITASVGVAGPEQTGPLPGGWSANEGLTYPQEPAPGDPALWRQRLRHDIRHELGTIIMLASAVAVSDDIGVKSKELIEQLLGGTRWLDHLLRQLDEDDDAQPLPSPERIRVDELAAEVVAGLRLATSHRVGF